MAWSTKEPNGRHKVGYRTPDGRIRARRFDRKVDADRFAAAVETDKNRGEWVDAARQADLEPVGGRVVADDRVAVAVVPRTDTRRPGSPRPSTLR